MKAQPIARPATSGNGKAENLGLASQASAPAPRLLSIPQAAAYLGVSAWALRHLIWDGQLPEVRVRRRVMVDVEDLQAFIRAAKRRHTP